MKGRKIQPFGGKGDVVGQKREKRSDQDL